MTLIIRADIIDITRFGNRPTAGQLAAAGLFIHDTDMTATTFTYGTCFIAISEEALRGDLSLDVNSTGLDILGTLENFGMAISDHQPMPDRSIALGLIEGPDGV